MSPLAARTRAFAASYGRAFASFLTQRDEPHLRAAYELGRDAVAGELSVLDLAVVHHDALADVLASSDDPRAVAHAAGDFFLEALSAYEMVQRGYREARETAALERRQADLLRQLSNFLTDASLALGASGSLEEVLQLVAEQARELLRAESCRVTLAWEHEPPIEAVSGSENEEWSATLQSGAAAHGAAVDRPARRRLTLREPLTTLAGRPIGSIELSSGDFSELDEAVLVQLAQMASAAVERQWRYLRH